MLFALPLMLGNLLQQMYNIADTWVVGRFLGADALADFIGIGWCVVRVREQRELRTRRYLKKKR